MTIANRKVIEILQAEGLEKGWDLIKGISKPLSYAEKRREEKTEAARKEKEDFLLSLEKPRPPPTACLALALPSGRLKVITLTSG